MATGYWPDGYYAGLDGGSVTPITITSVRALGRQVYRIAWTGMRVLKHDGSQHHGVGIQPTIPAARTIAGIRAGRDEMLEKAVEVVSP